MFIVDCVEMGSEIQKTRRDQIEKLMDLFINLVKFSKAIASWTNYLRLIFSGCICSECYTRLPNEASSLAFRAPEITKNQSGKLNLILKLRH